MLEAEQWYWREVGGIEAAPDRLALRAVLPWSHAEVVANRLGLYGPRETLVTACSSGAAALAVGSELITTGMADLVLAGGADAITRICYLGFNALKLLDPEPCRPFDRERRGMSIGEGAGFLVLESADHARRREARVYAEHLQSVIRAAKLLGVARVNTFAGRDWTQTVDAQWGRFLDTWRPLVACAEQNGVRIGIENCPMLFTGDEWPGGKNLATTPAIWRRMFEDIPSASFGLNFDPSHFVWQQMDYLKPLREFRERIFHVHAKDARLDRERLDDVGIMATPLEFHRPKLPGLGEVNWGRFFSVLTDTGYDGPVCVEVEDRAYEGSLEAREAALRQSLRYLRNFA